jgi:hypothetical protein
MATKRTAADKVAITVSPDPAQPGDGGGAPTDVTVIIPDEMEAAPAAAPLAGEPHGYAAWVVPAPAPLATAAVGTPGWYMGIRAGVEDRTGPFATWLGTNAPRATWPL